MTIGAGQRGQHPLPTGEAGAGHDGEHHRQVRRAARTAPLPPQAGAAGCGPARRRDRALIIRRARPRRRLVPGALHHLAQRLGGHRVGGVDGGDPGREVHRRLHAVDFVEPGLHPGSARRARHPRHVELDPAERRCVRPAGDGAASSSSSSHPDLVQHCLAPTVGSKQLEVPARSVAKTTGQSRVSGAAGPRSPKVTIRDRRATTSSPDWRWPPGAATVPHSTSSSGPPSVTCGARWRSWPILAAPTT